MNEQQRIVQEMQNYILAHLFGETLPQDTADHVGYSLRHADRLFRAVLGRSIREYIRLLRLTDAARRIAKDDKTILDVALDGNYSSHEGFTKAFSSAFGITPTVYRKGNTPIQYFIPYPVHPNFKGGTTMKNHTATTATFVERPARKLIYLPSTAGKDYWSYCQEMGCDWEGLQNSILSKFDSAALLTLPAHLTPAGFSNIASGIEVPADYAGTVPEHYLVAELPPVTMLYFQSAPYEDEEAFPDAIAEAFATYENYDPELFGYRYVPEKAPAFNFGACAATGARIAFPVRKK